ncbi:pyridoxamine 5'-phosphate oxidase family protein [Nitrospinota bacterium]
MAKIPEALHEPINAAAPMNVCLVGTVQPNGWAQISPKGSVIVYDDETIAYWDRGGGSTYDVVEDGTKVMVFLRNGELREKGLLPRGGIARFYGTATVYPEGSVREEVWERMSQQEREHDPEKKGRAVLLKIERAEDLRGDPLDL